MKTSTKGLIALMGHEAIVLNRYKDSKGIWTIGVGHTKAAGGLNPDTFTVTLTLEQAIDMFRKDIVKYENGVNNAVTWPVTQEQFDALVSFHFNTGAIAKATLTKSLNAGKIQQAGKEFMNWTKPKEIEGRRRDEQTLFLTGKYPPPIVTLYPADSSGRVLWSKGRKVDAMALMDAKPVVVDDPGVKPSPPSPPVHPGGFIAAIVAFISSLFKRKPA